MNDLVLEELDKLFQDNSIKQQYSQDIILRLLEMGTDHLDRKSFELYNRKLNFICKHLKPIGRVLGE